MMRGQMSLDLILILLVFFMVLSFYQFYANQLQFQSNQMLARDELRFHARELAYLLNSIPSNGTARLPSLATPSIRLLDGSITHCKVIIETAGSDKFVQIDLTVASSKGDFTDRVKVSASSNPLSLSKTVNCGESVELTP